MRSCSCWRVLSDFYQHHCGFLIYAVKDVNTGAALSELYYLDCGNNEGFL